MADVNQVNENLSGAGAGSVLNIKGIKLHNFSVFIRDGATPLVATIDLEVQRPGDDDWNILETYTTYPQIRTGTIVGSYEMRLNVSSYTSGVGETTLVEDA